jgi:hypothetical protein
VACAGTAHVACPALTRVWIEAPATARSRWWRLVCLYCAGACCRVTLTEMLAGAGRTLTVRLLCYAWALDKQCSAHRFGTAARRSQQPQLSTAKLPQTGVATSVFSACCYRWATTTAFVAIDTTYILLVISLSQSVDSMLMCLPAGPVVMMLHVAARIQLYTSQ